MSNGPSPHPKEKPRAHPPPNESTGSGGSSIYFMNQRWMNKVASWKVQKEKDDLPLPQLYFLLRLYGTT
jgi:hypothetical protein